MYPELFTQTTCISLLTLEWKGQRPVFYTVVESSSKIREHNKPPDFSIFHQKLLGRNPEMCYVAQVIEIAGIH